MNKIDLIEALAKENGLTKAEANAVVNVFFGEMANALASGDRVEIRGLCSFYVKEYKGYTGRNPKTGKEVQINPKKRCIIYILIWFRWKGMIVYYPCNVQIHFFRKFRT